MSAIGGAISQDKKKTPIVQNFDVTPANTEVDFTFPNNTKAFIIRNRGPHHVKYSYTETESGTIYGTIMPNANYSEDGIGTASLVIYFQTPASSQILEITSWS